MKNFSQNNLILTAFSSRAAADSFSNSDHLKIYSFDYFGDLDLKEIVDFSFSLKDKNLDFKTELLFKSIKKFLIQNSDKRYNLIYGSDWDNQAELLAKLEKIENLKLRGNSAATIFELNKKESLQHLFNLAENFGFKTPELFFKQKNLKNLEDKKTIDLIIKPYQSGGGLNLKVIKDVKYREKNFEYFFSEQKNDFYLQELLTGETRSCQFAADGKNAKILSFTKELKASRLNSELDNSFKYGGNILIKEDEKEIKILKKFINKITKEYFLQGINGIDYIKNDQGIFFIELNPRYTAAVELLKPIYQEELLNIYFRNSLATDYLKEYLEKDFDFYAKFIFYAEQDFKIKDDLRKTLKRIEREKAAEILEAADLKIKDLPEKEELFQAGDPVFTLLCKTKNSTDCLEIKNLIFSEFENIFRS